MNYVSVGQLYLYDNPLLKRPLELSDITPLVVGHWGTTPGQNTYLEGTYCEVYSDISQDEAGLKKLFTQFSFPGGISSLVAPTSPVRSTKAGQWIAIHVDHATITLRTFPCTARSVHVSIGENMHELPPNTTLRVSLPRSGAATVPVGCSDDRDR